MLQCHLLTAQSPRPRPGMPESSPLAVWRVPVSAHSRPPDLILSPEGIPESKSPQASAQSYTWMLVWEHLNSEFHLLSLFSLLT